MGARSSYLFHITIRIMVFRMAVGAEKLALLGF
jgi:hypothetical protein